MTLHGEQATGKAIGGMEEQFAAEGVLVASGAKAITQAIRAGGRQRQGHVLLRQGMQTRLLIDFENDQMVSASSLTPAALAEELAASFDQLRMQAISAFAYERLSRGLHAHPLRPLLWQWGQQSRGWQDLDAKLAAAKVRLLRWPDFRVLGRQHDSFRLCSLLLRRPSSVDECTRLLDMPAERVLSFVHPAFLCGYANLEPATAESAPAPASPVRSPAREDGTLLARMWRSVRRLGGS